VCNAADTRCDTQRPTNPQGNAKVSKSTRKPQIGKVYKPRPDFPLFPHATGRWAKKIRQQFHYFGKTADDPTGQAALEKWLEQKDDLLAGRTPRGNADGLAIYQLVNHYLNAKKARLDSGEISPRHYADLYANCQSVGDAFGWNRLVVDLAADDFQRLRRAFAKHWGAHRMRSEVGRVRSLFKYGYEAGLIQQPVRFGPDFKKPDNKTMLSPRHSPSCSRRWGCTGRGWGSTLCGTPLRPLGATGGTK